MFETVALYCERNYGTLYDRDEEFFICPECGEPIYKDDWRDNDFFLGNPPFNWKEPHYYCPICENHLGGECID